MNYVLRVFRKDQPVTVHIYERGEGLEMLAAALDAIQNGAFKVTMTSPEEGERITMTKDRV